MDMSIRFPNLGIDLDYVGKSIHIFGFEITIYGILIAVGMLLGICFVVLEAKRKNYDQDRYLDMMIFSLIGAVIGARLYYVAFSWNLYRGNLFEILNTRNGGMAFYGGLLGGVLAAAIFCKIKKQSFWAMADIACMGLLIGQIIGRWGNFFNRESFGEYTDGLFAMQLPLSAVHTGEVTALMRENLETIDGISYIQVQPAFLYESLWCLLLFIVLLALRRRKRFDGEVFMNYLAGYGLGRFFIEWIRTDSLYWPGTRIAVSQVVSAFLFVFFTLVVLVRRTMVKKREEIRKRRREAFYQEEAEAAGEDLDWSVPKRETEDTENASEDVQKTDMPDGSQVEESAEQKESVDIPESVHTEDAAEFKDHIDMPERIPLEESAEQKESIDMPETPDLEEKDFKDSLDRSDDTELEEAADVKSGTEPEQETDSMEDGEVLNKFSTEENFSSLTEPEFIKSGESNP